MGFFEHLAELRQRLIYCLVGVAVCCILGFVFWREIYAFLAAPIQAAFDQVGMPHRLIFTGPLVPVRFALQVGLYAGIFLAAPVIFWQVWLFVAPGLYRHERRFVLPFILSSSVLFMMGAYFAHRVVLPLTLTFLLQFGRELFEPLISINEYFSLWLTMVLWMGVIFELPVLIFILSWLGVVTPRFMIHYLRHAVLAIVVVAAVITPTTDAFTMAVFALPMIGLYLVGIGVSSLVSWRRQARAAAQVEANN
ncbi:MAG: twin-arginine translocase subunit TatC [Acidobacteria bacterium]|nr:twin-arginine translocase subunit TatC [Acidobacteriota bacterium]